jgi:hypothetical protein
MAFRAIPSVMVAMRTPFLTVAGVRVSATVGILGCVITVTGVRGGEVVDGAPPSLSFPSLSPPVYVHFAYSVIELVTVSVTKFHAFVSAASLYHPANV